MPGLAVLERALALFALAQGVHIAWWRILGPPRGYLYWFAAIWAVGFALVLGVWLAVGGLLLGTLDMAECVAWFGAFVAYIALCGAYVMIYPAITDLSPSLEIIRALGRAAGCRLATSEIERLPVIAAHRVAYRVRNLQSSSLVRSDNGILRLTPFGAAIGRLIDAYRRLLGIPRWAGG